MDSHAYNRMTNAQLAGRRVRTLVEMRNGRFVIPPGSTAVIERKFKGFELLFDPCPHCRIQSSISRVSPRHVELLPEEAPETS